MEKVNSKYYCFHCEKYYKSIQSYCNHKRKFHKKMVPNGTIPEPFTPKPEPNDNIILQSDNILEHCNFKIIKNGYKILKDNKYIYICKHCNKEYEYRQSRNRHQKNCYITSFEKLKKENVELKENFQNQVNDLKQQLSDLMNKTYKMHPKTLQKINKQLNNNCNIFQKNEYNINNINNINIVQFGKEDVINKLSKKEQLMILNKKHQSLNHLIEYVHFNDKFPQYKNIAITNMKDGLAYMYNEDKNKFIAIDKNELIMNVLETRMLDIEDIYSTNVNNINDHTRKNIKFFINKMTNNNEYLELKKMDIKLILYNNTEPNMIKEIEC